MEGGVAGDNEAEQHTANVTQVMDVTNESARAAVLGDPLTYHDTMSRCNVPIPATLGRRSRANRDAVPTFRHRLRSPDASDGRAPSLPAVAHSHVPLSYIPRGRLVRRSI